MSPGALYVQRSKKHTLRREHCRLPSPLPRKRHHDDPAILCIATTCETISARNKQNDIGADTSDTKGIASYQRDESRKATHALRHYPRTPLTRSGWHQIKGLSPLPVHPDYTSVHQGTSCRDSQATTQTKSDGLRMKGRPNPLEARRPLTCLIELCSFLFALRSRKESSV